MAKKGGRLDKVIIVSDEDDLVRILDAEEINGNLHSVDQSVVVPVADASMVKIGSEGRVFFYNCSLPYINEIYHLAEVEKNLVLNKALVFKYEQDEKKGPGLFMYFIIAALIVAIIFK